VALVLAVAVTAALPGLVALRWLAPRLGTAIGVPIAVGRVRWNPFTGRWTVSGLRVGPEHEPPVAVADRVVIRAGLVDLLRGRNHLRDFRIERARLRLVRTATGWSAGFPVAAPAAGESGFAFAVGAGEIRQATVVLDPGAGKPVRVLVHRLVLGGVAVGPDGARASGSAHARLGGRVIRIAFAARRADTRERTRARFIAHRLDVGRLAPLLGLPTGEVGGALTVSGAYEGSGPVGRMEGVATGRLGGRALVLGEAGTPGVAARAVTVSRSELRLARREAALGVVRLHGPAVSVRETADGPRIAGIPHAGIGEGPGIAWTVTAQGASVDAGRLEYTAPDRPRMVIGLPRLTLGAVGAAADPVPVSGLATLETGGHVTVRGQVVRAPLGLDAEVMLADVELPPLVAWLGGPLTLVSGRGGGSLRVRPGEDGAVASGDLALDDVKSAPPDPNQKEEVMACHRLVLHVRQAAWSPPRIDLASIEATAPYVLVHRGESGIFPLSLLPPAAQPPVPTPPPAPSTPFSFHVDRVDVTQGRVDFYDTTLPLPYWRALAELALTARGVAVPPLRVARFRGRGRIDEVAPVDVAGNLGATTRITADVRGLALQPFNPYVHPVLAYEVSSGAATVHSEIVLDRADLESTNRLVLSRLGISGGAEGDFLTQQLGIPLTLAVALMKDYRGNIALDIPVAGTVTAPAFSLRELVLQAVVQAIKGAILSPLNALGRLVLRDGRIERVDVSPIPFPPGSAELGLPGRDRVVQVGRILAEHPELALRIRGQVADADVHEIRTRAALASVDLTSDPGPLRAYLLARQAGRPLPALDGKARQELDRLEATLPWPAEELRALAAARGEAAAAALAESSTAGARISVDDPAAPGVPDLAPQPEAALALAG
jgi:uncharacterized protein DUF748